MSEQYNKAYYDQYDVGIGKVNYEESEYTKGFLQKVADHIVDDLHPKTVLDAGCAMGHLVAALRDHGVEAYGVDISEYAISKVRKDIRPYCAVGSLTEPLPACLPRRYDLVVTIEVLEHLYEEEGKKAIQNLCMLSDHIIFSSTPDDFTEKTHFNVQQREYWAQLFAAEGFFDDLNYRPAYLTQYAICFKKSNNWMQQVWNYERNIRISDSRLLELAAELDRAQRTKRYGKVYFDCGNGLSEESSVCFCIGEDHGVKYKIDLPEGCRAVRVDPAEGCACLVWNLQVRCESQFLKVLGHNGMALSEVYIFRTADPQFYFDSVPAGSRRLEIEAEIICFEQGAWIKFVQEVEEIERDRTEQAASLQIVERNAADLQSQLAVVLNRDSALEVELKDIIRKNSILDRELADATQKNCALSRELEGAKERNRALKLGMNETAEQNRALEQELAQYQERYDAELTQCEDLKQQLVQTQQAYSAISNAFFWKITKPFRAILDGVKSLLKRNYYTHLFCKGLKCWKENGIVYTWRKVQDKRHCRQDLAKTAQGIYPPEELERQRKHVFPQNVKISIVVPLYNTPEQYLREMIQSVVDQTYRNWELCLVDGSDETHQEVETICRRYIEEDSRIKYRKLEKNEGISGNTNVCIDMSTGDYIALFDHDDLLHPAALHEVMRAICEQGADFVYTDESTFHNKPEDAYCPNFKPNYAPDTLRSYNYICHLSVFSKQLLQRAGGGFRSEFDGSQDYDMILRLTEKAEHIVHIPIILYYWRAHENSVAADVSAKPYTILAAKKAIAAHMERLGLKGEVLDSAALTTYRIRYEIKGTPLISILIPNKDHIADLKKCITSIVAKTTYPAWEIVVVENGSESEETFAYYEQLKTDQRIRVVQWEGDFNYSAINNFGFRYTKGEFVLLLNNDTEVITPDWLQEMLMFCQRKDVGAAGCMLYYPDDTVQHAGVILGLGGVAGHSHKYAKRGDYGYMCRLALAQDLTAVTAACMMIRRDVWEEIKGLDPRFRVAFNDVDLCMRIRKAGYLIAWTPYAELYHYESKSRGYEDTPEKQTRFASEVRRFKERWSKELVEGDPYYNPNLTLSREDFSLR